MTGLVAGVPASDFKKAATGLMSLKFKSGAPIPTTHLAMGRFIADTFTGQYQVTYRTTSRTGGEWFVWNSRIHEHTEQQLDELLATAFIDALTARAKELAGLGDSESASIVGKQAARLSSVKEINSIKARVREEFRVPMKHFDNEKRWLVMSNGYVLDTSDLSAEPLPPHPSRPVTKTLGVSIDPTRLDTISSGERWMAWLNEFVPNEDDQRFLQEAAGAALLGGGNAKNIVHLVGPSDTGKSTYLNTMEAVFGSKASNGYAGTLTPGAIVKRNGSTNFAQSDARGVRFLKLSEPSTERTDDSFLKNLSGGGEPIVTERKGQDSEEWLAECVLHIAANEVVRFDIRDQAIINRINIVKFPVPIKHKNYNFVNELVEAEGDAILLWVLAGARRFQGQGRIYVPECVQERAEANVEEISAALSWLREAQVERMVTVDTNAKASEMMQRSVAYKEFQAWCMEQGRRIPTLRTFAEDINRANGAPEGFYDRRPGGSARIFGVVKRNLTPAEKKAEMEFEHEMYNNMIRT